MEEPGNICRPSRGPPAGSLQSENDLLKSLASGLQRGLTKTPGAAGVPNLLIARNSASPAWSPCRRLVGAGNDCFSSLLGRSSLSGLALATLPTEGQVLKIALSSM